MASYRIVASDMDETFLGFSHEIPQANIEALRRMRELGVAFVPASGRAYGSIMASLAPIADLLEGSYVISYNGGCVNRVGDPTPLTAHRLGFDIIQRVFDWMLPHNVGFHFYGLDGTCWGWRMPQAEFDALRGHMDVVVTHEASVEFLRDVPIAKMLVVNMDLNYLHQLLAQMPEEVLAGTSPTFSSGRYLEFNPMGVDKGLGLTTLCGVLDIGLEQTVACGDAANDLPMIEKAGCGVVVSNATSDVAAVADYHAAATCSDGVLAEVVREILEPAAQAEAAAGNANAAGEAGAETDEDEVAAADEAEVAVADAAEDEVAAADASEETADTADAPEASAAEKEASDAGQA